MPAAILRLSASPSADLSELRRSLRRRSRHGPGGAVLLQKQCNQGGPAGLVRGAEPASGVAVEIFEEVEIVAEGRFGLRERGAAEERPVASLVAQEEAAQPAGKLIGRLAEMNQPTGPDRTFDLEVVAVIAVKPPQRFDEQKGHRHPDRPAPVG